MAPREGIEPSSAGPQPAVLTFWTTLGLKVGSITPLPRAPPCQVELVQLFLPFKLIPVSQDVGFEPTPSNGDTYGVRTRDLQRDRLAFQPTELRYHIKQGELFSISYLKRIALNKQDCCIRLKKWQSRWESNPRLRRDRATFQPLNYGTILNSRTLDTGRATSRWLIKIMYTYLNSFILSLSSLLRQRGTLIKDDFGYAGSDTLTGHAVSAAFTKPQPLASHQSIDTCIVVPNDIAISHALSHTHSYADNFYKLSHLPKPCPL